MHRRSDFPGRMRPTSTRSASASAATLAALIAGGCVGLDTLTGGSDGPPVTPGEGGAPDAGSEAAPVVDAGFDAAVDAGPSWRLFSFDSFQGAWSSVDLATIWTGPNAPPPRGIAAATELMDVDRLMVVTEDGTYYVRANGVWQAPRKGGDVWPQLPSTVDTVANVGHKFYVTLDPNAPFEESITFVNNPKAYLYRFIYNADPAKDAIVFDNEATMKDSDGGARQGTERAIWDFEVLDVQNPKPEDHLVFYGEYSDGKLWRFDAYFNWTSTTPADCPIWQRRPGAPDFSTIRAAFYSQGSRTARLLGP